MSDTAWISTEVVAILAPLTVLQQRKTGIWAARFTDLGLTAYGSSRAKAEVGLRRILIRFVQAHREAGTLEARLDRSGLEWWVSQEGPATTAGSIRVGDFSGAAWEAESPHRDTELVVV